MTESGYPQARYSRLGELTVWSAAALLMLSVHAGFAYYLMQEPEEQDAGGQPPAAIMIEMAAIPEAVKTEETTQADDVEDAQEVKSDSSEPVEEAAAEEPPPPQPEPVAETPPPEPVQPPEPPVEEIVEPQKIPEPEPIDPVQEQMMAELENVEVPLPVMRPPPPPVEKKVEKKEPEDKRPDEKKKVERQRPKPQQASDLRETAKAEAQQSDRTAASRSNAGFFSSSSMSKADWDAKVRSAMQRRLARAAGKSGMAITVSFKIDSGGSVGGARILLSTGDSAMDQKLLAVIQKASVSPPPAGANTSFTLPVLFK